MLKNKKEKVFYFTGPLAEPISNFFEEVRLSGYVYNEEGYYLRQIARIAEQEGLGINCLPKEFVESWCQKREHECNSNWSSRVVVMRKLAEYMSVRGMEAHKPAIKVHRRESAFTPHIYTDSQLQRIFEQADLLPFYPNCPNRGSVASLLFRILYGCGLRISEALNLTMQDVDMDKGVLTILDSKLGKSRYVPMFPSLTERCRQYVALIRVEAPVDAPFFPAPDGGPYSERAVYTTFRHILENAGIPHTGSGPRIHDLRHTFSVCCLKKWILAGKDLNVALPILSAYLGHKDLKGTQKYLRLTADMYPDIVKTMELQFGDTVPGGNAYDEG